MLTSGHCGNTKEKDAKFSEGIFIGLAQWFPNCGLWLPGDPRKQARGAGEDVQKAHFPLQYIRL